jgi:copper resistance protein B
MRGTAGLCVRAIALLSLLAVPLLAARAQPATGPVPPFSDEDRAAAFPDLGGMHVHDTMLESPFNTFVLFDALEAQNGADDEILDWSLDAWLGRELDKLWVRSEGARASGTTQAAELHLLWGRGFARWWTLVAGLRQDFEPGPDRGWAAAGVKGLAPYGIEVEATAYVGDGGRAAARLEADYEVLFTNRLILEPQVELNWYAQDDGARGLGAGLATAELELRLRYEIRRELAPYVGVVREKRFGSTADFARAAGVEADDTRFVVGFRFWF